MTEQQTSGKTSVLASSRASESAFEAKNPLDGPWMQPESKNQPLASGPSSSSVRVAQLEAENSVFSSEIVALQRKLISLRSEKEVDFFHLKHENDSLKKVTKKQSTNKQQLFYKLASTSLRTCLLRVLSRHLRNVLHSMAKYDNGRPMARTSTTMVGSEFPPTVTPLGSSSSYSSSSSPSVPHNSFAPTNMANMSSAGMNHRNHAIMDNADSSSVLAVAAADSHRSAQSTPRLSELAGMKMGSRRSSWDLLSDPSPPPPPQLSPQNTHLQHPSSDFNGNLSSSNTTTAAANNHVTTNNVPSSAASASAPGGNSGAGTSGMESSSAGAMYGVPFPAQLSMAPRPPLDMGLSSMSLLSVSSPMHHSQRSLAGLGVAGDAVGVMSPVTNMQMQTRRLAADKLQELDRRFVGFTQVLKSMLQTQGLSLESRQELEAMIQDREVFGSRLHTLQADLNQQQDQLLRTSMPLSDNLTPVRTSLSSTVDRMGELSTNHNHNRQSISANQNPHSVPAMLHMANAGAGVGAHTRTSSTDSLFKTSFSSAGSYQPMLDNEGRMSLGSSQPLSTPGSMSTEPSRYGHTAMASRSSSVATLLNNESPIPLNRRSINGYPNGYSNGYPSGSSMSLISEDEQLLSLKQLSKENSRLTEQLIEQSMEQVQNLDLLSADRQKLMSQLHEYKLKTKKYQQDKILLQQRLQESIRAMHELSAENTRLTEEIWHDEHMSNSAENGFQPERPVDQAAADVPSFYGSGGSRSLGRKGSYLQAEEGDMNIGLELDLRRQLEMEQERNRKVTQELDSAKQALKKRTEEANETILKIAQQNFDLTEKFKTAVKQVEKLTTDKERLRATLAKAATQEERNKLKEKESSPLSQGSRYAELQSQVQKLVLEKAQMAVEMKNEQERSERLENEKVRLEAVVEDLQSQMRKFKRKVLGQFLRESSETNLVPSNAS
eukprot:GILK01010714.1.p1 GENE.GILK01010714.1~~GILK01010714.1.p1  ORF type:complete len:945 (+),score=196.16 GILK01010714.1:90-2924(+)